MVDREIASDFSQTAVGHLGDRPLEGVGDRLLLKLITRIAQATVQLLAGGYLLYRLKSIVGINLSPHYHAVEIIWHPLKVWQDIAETWLA